MGWPIILLMLGRIFACVAAVFLVTLAGTPAALARQSPGLHSEAGRILDGSGRPARLEAANWYGAETADFVVGGLQRRPLDAIVEQIGQLGFNTVRLPWSNELLERNPTVPDYAVAANPRFRGLTAMEVFDQVVHALTAHHLMVILDNHTSDAEWCCGDDGNDLWYNDRYPESSWISDWREMATRYRDDPLVVGVDLRNEPRIRATWGGPETTDWRAAAERAGNAVLGVNPRLLVLVEGINYAGDLSGVQALPVRLRVPHRVVYEAHDYGWYEHGFTGYQQWLQQITPRWGYLVTGPHPLPFWIGEFGTCTTRSNCVSATSPDANGYWFGFLTAFLEEHGVSWGYWALNGTQSTGTGRTWNTTESYGVLNSRWDGVASRALTRRLGQIGLLGRTSRLS
jgi:endoglucanase